MTSPRADWDRLARYVAGELPPAEAAEVRRWLDANPADARALEQLEAATRNLAPTRPVDVEAALDRVKARLRSTPAASAGLTFPASWGRYAMLAAAAVVMLVAGVLWRATRGVSVGPAAAPLAYTTGVGARDSILLADGSRAVLGPASRLVVRGREVELSGEALFVVVHDEQRPFIVRAGGAVIRDVGTEFAVRSDPDEAVRVVVRQGSVALQVAGDSAVLGPGDVGSVEAGNRIVAQRGAATEDDLAWTRGRLVFRDASVAEVAADLRRWYGVELRVTDSALVRRHFTGSFSGEPVSRVVEAIALALGAHAVRRGDTVFVRGAAPR